MNTHYSSKNVILSVVAFLAMLFSTAVNAQSCDNVTDGGIVCCDQASNVIPFDPQPIANVKHASGGTGAVEYLWLSTTNPYNTNFSSWTMLPNSNTASYDPGPLSQTTFFVRCARRAGCTDYVRESNVIVVTVSPCDNITDAGKIASNQVACGSPFDPALISGVVPAAGGGNTTAPIQYAWFKSTVGGAFSLTNGDWELITGAIGVNYDPTAITKTTYYVRVARRSGCVSWLSSNIVSVTMKPGLNASAMTVSPTCNGYSNGSIMLSVSGGVAPFTYAWNYGQIPANTQNPTNLPAGTYTVTVTDANTCMAMIDVKINQPAPFAITFDKTDVKCAGGSNGTAVVQVKGGTPQYSYLWTNNMTAPQVGGLTAGRYYVTVTDIKGCQKVSSVLIGEPTPLKIETSSTDVSCFVGNDGTAEVVASGGTAPYTYYWSNGQTTSTATGLQSGIYTITVRDANGCTQVGSVAIKQPNAIVVASTKTNVSCNDGSNGAVTLTVSGGTPTYTYAWSNGATTASISNVKAGTYRATVTDSKGCSQVAVVTLTEPTAIVLATNQINIKCNGGTNGSASVVASGGSPAYSYIWSNGQASATISGLAAGVYTVTVTDSQGCQKVATVNITQPAAIVLTMTGSNLKCGGSNAGTASVVANGGSAPYKYTWSNGANSATLNGLVAGSYVVTVTDGSGCTARGEAVVTEPTPIQLTTVVSDPSCNNGKDGMAEVTASGGTAPYTYLWSMGQTTPKITMAPGTYTVTVTDANGCQKFTDVTISNPTPMTIKGTITNIKCNGENSGAIAIDVTGGGAPYTFNWSNSNTTGNNTGLGAGTYTVTVTDKGGCTAVKSFEVKQPAKLILEIAANNIKCNGAKDGNITVKPVGGTAPYSAIWSNGATSLSQSGLAAGVYNITVTDANGCIEKGTAEVLEPAELTLTTNTQDEKCFNQKNGAANVVPTGGTAPYTFKWSNGGTNAAITALAPGNYTVTVSDKNNCQKTASVTIKAATSLSYVDKVTPVKCFGDKSGSASIIVSGGTAPYDYTWSNGEKSADLTSVAAGVYAVMVRDANNCMLQAQVTITQPSSPLTIATSHVSAACNSANGSAKVVAAGGTAGYSYTWSNGATTDEIKNIIAGNYTVTVTDANGCTKTATVAVTQPSPLFLSTTQTNVECNGGSNGFAKVTAAGGVNPLKYVWSNGSTNAEISNVKAGTYKVTVTDANGCMEMTSVTISEPEPIVVTTTGSTLTCFGGNDGSVTSTVVSGGVGPYTYRWSNGVIGSSQLGLLKAGTYTVTATDQNGCTGSATAEVGTPTQVKVTGTTTPAKCKGGNDGTASISASGGTGSYTYVWSNGATSSSISGLGADNYGVTVTDSNGCSASTIIQVREPFGFEVKVFPTGLNCYNDTNGTGKVIITGAPVGIVGVKWSTGETAPVIGGLGAGTYSVTVVDQNGCTETAGFSITNPAKLEFTSTSTNVTCAGKNNGTASVINVSGGKAPYFYQWSNGRTTQSTTGLAPGSYTVTVQDSNGCSDKQTVVVTEPTPLVCQANITSQVTTYNGKEGAAVATASGGTKPYTFRWSNGATTDVVSGLGTGTYTVTITDANGCTCSSTITLGNKAKLGNYVWEDLNGDGNQQPNEPGLANVTVTMTGKMDNGTPVTAVQVTDGTGMYMFDGLMSGMYKVTFEQPNGFMVTRKDFGSDLEDSDVDPITKMSSTYVLKNGEANLSIDAGYIKLAKIGNFVWFDKNKDGVQDTNEPGFAGIMVKLYKPGADNQFGTADDMLLQTTTTDNTGMYMFSDVMPGMQYQVEFMKSSIPGGYDITKQNVGDDSKDSDADPITGRSHTIVVGFNQPNNLGIDMGLFVPCDNVLDGGLVGPKEQILCGPGIAAIFTSIAPATGGNTQPVEYLWLKSTKGPNYVPGSSDWSPILGAAGSTYGPGFVVESTWYIRCARRKGCEPYTGESNVIAVLVNKAPNAEIATYPKDAKTLEMLDFAAADAGAGATYSWNFGASAVPQFATGKSATIMYNAVGQKTVTLTVTKDGCSASTSVTVNVLLGPGAINRVAINNFVASPIDNQKVDLKWNTITPALDNMFVVERSKDGISFTQIATIDANTFTNSGTYTFTDTKPTIGHNEYRIKHVSVAGDLVFSTKENANIFASFLKEVAIYPNPFTDRVNIELSRVTPQGAKVEVVNAHGQVVISEEIAGGQTRKEVDMSQLQSGFYIIRIDFDGQRTEVHRATRLER